MNRKTCFNPIIVSLLTAVCTIVAASPARADVVLGVDWETAADDVATGTLCGSSISITPVNNGGPSTGNFSSAEYSAAPLSAAQECAGYVSADEWTATFDPPVSDLLLYPYYWRGPSAGGPDPVTYTFNHTFTIESGMTGATIDGTTLEVPLNQFQRGILKFTGPVSTLTLTTSATSTGAGQALTFGVVVLDSDADSDGVPDACDQCLGDDATGDTDGDGVCDDIDPCPIDNPDDTDADGVCDSDDACPGFDDSLDEDGDTVPDACDVCAVYDDTLDADTDGVPDGCDNCPDHANLDQLDCDEDGKGDVCELADCSGSLLCMDCNSNGIPDGCDEDPLQRRSANFSDANLVNGGFGGVSSVFAADMNGDGNLDVLSVAWEADDIAWWENTAGDGTAWTKHTVVNNFQEVTDAAAADLDGDGDLDIVATSNTNVVAWWENTSGDGLTWSRHNIDTSFNAAQAVFAADVDGDGDMDFAAASFTLQEIAWWENDNGDGTAWTKQTVGTSFAGAQAVSLADIDGDEDIDVLGAGWGANEIAWWENTNGDGSAWTKWTVGTDFAHTRSAFAADLDGDGDKDIVGTAAADSDIAWWENTSVTGDGTTWTQHMLDDDFFGAWATVAADLDGDGDNDILAAAKGGGEVAWWDNAAGDGSVWIKNTVDDNFSDAWDVFAADVDGDGDTDALGVGFNPDDIAWWENQGGQFSVTASATAPVDWAEGQTDDVFELLVTHNGRAGDADLELSSLAILFEQSPGVPMTTPEAAAIFDGLSIYLDDGSGDFDAGTDLLVESVGTLTLVAGVQTVDMTPGNPLAQVAVGIPNTYFVVVTLLDPLSAGQGALADITYLATQSAAVDSASGCPLLQELPGGDVTATITFADSDGDGVADSVDVCPGFDDALDADGDGIPDDCDACPGSDDNEDADGDGIPDGCDDCSDVNVHNVTQGTFHPTIQDAITTAITGDVIELGACTFYEDDITFPNGVDVTLRGAGRDLTIIDGGGAANPSNPILGLDDTNQTAATQISDLTLRNGNTDGHAGGGAVHITNTSPAFSDVAFLNNGRTGTGAAGAHLYASGTASPSFIRCEFTGGYDASEGLLLSSGGSLTALQCLFHDNDVTRVIRGSVSIVNCTIDASNGAFLGTINATNSVWVGWVGGGSTINATRCLYDGATGDNIDGLPTFEDAGAGDYRLAAGSLGIDAADYDAYVTAGGGAEDLNGDPLPADDCLTTDTGVGALTYLDMGAYEYQSDTVLNITQGTSHATIQDALDMAANGDVIELGACTFYEDNITFPNGIDVTLRGAGRDLTIIDGGGAANPDNPILNLDNTNQTAATQISDLTLRNGASSSIEVPGAIHIDNASPEVRDVNFLDNAGPGAGSGQAHARVRGGTAPLFRRCVFSGGSDAYSALNASTVTMFQCSFADNATNATMRLGGGTHTVMNCTVSASVTAMLVVGGVINAHNSVFDGTLTAYSGGVINTTRCLYDGATGDNIDGLPTFEDAGAGDYRLAAGSLGIDAADYDAYITAGGGAEDLNGDPCPVDDTGTPDTGYGTFTYLDMGAYEFQGTTIPGDCDHDGSVDLDDYANLDACLTGPDGGLGTDCECFDLDDDGDVDLADFAEFQVSFTGN